MYTLDDLARKIGRTKRDCYRIARKLGVGTDKQYTEEEYVAIADYLNVSSEGLTKLIKEIIMEHPFITIKELVSRTYHPSAVIQSQIASMTMDDPTLAETDPIRIEEDEEDNGLLFFLTEENIKRVEQEGL
jgi:hypothetical protein